MKGLRARIFWWVYWRILHRLELLPYARFLPWPSGFAMTVGYQLRWYAWKFPDVMLRYLYPDA